MGAGTGRSNKRTSDAPHTGKWPSSSRLRRHHPAEGHHGLAQYRTSLGARRQSRQQRRSHKRTFPSNLANRRNVGQRHGPAFSGQPPLNDIFKN